MWVVLLALGWHALGQTPGRTATYAPGKLPRFTFKELVSLSRNQPLAEATEKKLTTVLNSVVLDNSAPAPLRVKKLGPTLRVAEWNIERGENFDWIVLALKDEKGFRSKVAKDNPKLTPATLDQIAEEARILRQSGVLVLNEVDLGMTAATITMLLANWPPRSK